MSAGLTRSEVYGKLISSAEYSGRRIDPVIRLYYAALAKAPDCAGLRSLSKALNTGALALTGVADELASSAEFVKRYGSLDNTCRKTASSLS